MATIQVFQVISESATITLRFYGYIGGAELDVNGLTMNADGKLGENCCDFSAL